jgi:YVTN family beta-propeller protein
VFPINIATNKLLQPIPVGVGPQAIWITPNGKSAYVSNYNMDLGRTVTAISTATNKAVKTITVGRAPEDMAFTPNSATAYVSSLYTNTVIPISTATNKAGKAISVGKGPFGTAITHLARPSTSPTPRRTP